MMEVEQLTIPKKKLEEEYQGLVQALRQNAKLRKQEIYQDMRRVYGHLRHGKKIVDVYDGFKKAGLNEDGDSKLAIARADSKVVVCKPQTNGSAKFFHDNGGKRLVRNILWSYYGDKNDITVPAGTFEWKKKENGFPRCKDVQTLVPIIPAKILVTEVKALLKNFHILWEVEEWKPVPPRDPILLKRLTPNLFGVLATWNLTKLERAIIRGRITEEV